MKKLIFMLLLMMTAMSVMAETHTVQRGETLQTIAQTYNISEAELIAANPGVQNLFYIGMKLQIPGRTIQVGNIGGNSTQHQYTGDTQSMPQQNDNPVTPTQENQNNVVQSNVAPGFQTALTFGLAIGKKIVGTKGRDLTFIPRLGVNYWATEINRGFFVGGMLGMMYLQGAENEYNKTHEERYSILLTPQFGYALTDTGKKWGITPYGAIDFGIPVSGKIKGHNISEKMENLKCGFLGEAGLMLRLGEFNVGAAYLFDFDDKDNGCWMVSIGWGF